MNSSTEIRKETKSEKERLGGGMGGFSTSLLEREWKEYAFLYVNSSRKTHQQQNTPLHLNTDQNESNTKGRNIKNYC